MKVEKVEIYVEGPSDKLAMEALLRPLIDVKLKVSKLNLFPPKAKIMIEEVMLKKIY